MTKELKACGVVVKRIVILPDDIEDISTEVRVLCSGFTYVFTCGGVGPTHDDITFEAIAKAFEEELVISPEIKRVLEQYYKGDDLKTALKMAKVLSNYYATLLQLGQILFKEAFFYELKFLLIITTAEKFVALIVYLAIKLKKYLVKMQVHN